MKTLLKSLLLCLFAVAVIGCGWKPDVTAVPITEPWAAMKFPVGTETSIVIQSDPTEFRAVHKGNDAGVITGYVDAMKAQGWTMSDFNTSDEDSALATADVSKGSDQFTVRAYKFDGSSTAVAIEKK